MKKFLFLFKFMLIVTPVWASVYVIIDKNTHEIVSFSSENDAVFNPANQQLVVLPGKKSDYELEYDPKYYKYEGSRFVVNVKKMTDEQKAVDEIITKGNEEAMIHNRAMKKACEDLVAEGKQFKYIKCSNYE